MKTLIRDIIKEGRKNKKEKLDNPVFKTLNTIYK